MRVFHKAYVYLTCGSRLLVFEEPDNPAIGLQVPGGTVDPGESYLIAAHREFTEETGLRLHCALTPFFDEDFVVGPKSPNLAGSGEPERPVRGSHRRRMYHARLPRVPAEEWEHFEMTPSFGGDPIRFRLFWLDLSAPRAMDPGNFYAGFGAPLAALRSRLAQELG
ncbi:hypothetical protein GCM10011316_07360 [Roseibium aquae]|uniref:Nudix hydrolase domain-containing protein n=1 Tax=Roseibium aquae TaxID=1323746 RepID=A0A916WXA9_9HYPH|nr:NUDIX domain-containing protein [Roseibium aquae]GGB37822.1 hypothetical protein GCM10011316_07360 [Roseibium aquae]